MRMRGNRVLVRPDAAPTTSEGGLEIPVDAREQQTVGVVVYVGTHADVADLAPGDRVAFGRYSGTPFDGVKELAPKPGEAGLVLLRGDDILAEVNEVPSEKVAHVEGQ